MTGQGNGAYVACACPRNAPPGPPSPPEWHCHGCGYWNPSLDRDDRQTSTCRTCGADRQVAAERPCVVQVESFRSDDVRSPCGARAGVEVLSTSGAWEPWCEYHVYWRGTPASHVRPAGRGESAVST